MEEIWQVQYLDAFKYSDNKIYTHTYIRVAVRGSHSLLEFRIASTHMLTV